MKVQIYTMQTVEEALAVAAVGVDFIGITPSRRGLPGEVSNDVAREISDALEGHACSVALSVEHEMANIADMVAAVRPDVLHLCGDIAKVTPEVVRDLRPMIDRIVPGIMLLQAIPMTGPEALAHAAAYAPVSDFLILDSVAPHIGGIGAAGVVHDWSLSREIVRQSPRPVILAGGLNESNVAEGIARVSPWGVDSLTHTNRALPTGGFRKDIERIRRFVAAARPS